MNFAIKNFENQSTFAEVVTKSWVSFSETQCNVITRYTVTDKQPNLALSVFTLCDVP